MAVKVSWEVIIAQSSRCPSDNETSKPLLALFANAPPVSCWASCPRLYFLFYVCPLRCIPYSRATPSRSTTFVTL